MTRNESLETNGGSEGMGIVAARPASSPYENEASVWVSTTSPCVASQRLLLMPQRCAAAAMSISRACAPATRITCRLLRMALDPAVM